MSHEKLVVGWVGAPLVDLHLNEAQDPWPSHVSGLKLPFNPESDGPRFSALRESDYVKHFGGNSYNGAVAQAADARFSVQMLWAKGKSEQATAIEEDMLKRGIHSQAAFNVDHDNGGSIVKAMDGDRGIITLPRTPLHETITGEHIRDFLSIRGLGAVSISSLKSPELNARFNEILREVHASSARSGLERIFTSHNAGTGEFTPDLISAWNIWRHTLTIGNRDEYDDLYGQNTARNHAEHGTEYSEISVCTDGTNPMQIAFSKNVVKDAPKGGVVEVQPIALDKSQVIDTTGAGDRTHSVFAAGIHYAQVTGQLTVRRLAQIGEFAASEAGSVIQHVGGHGDKPYPSAS